MKVLFSITYYRPYVSGLTLAAARWAEGLVRDGTAVTVLCMQHDRTLVGRGMSKGVRIVRARWFARLSKGFLSWEFIRQSWRLTGSHDVTVVHLPQPEGIIPALFARLQGKRVCAVYHCEVRLADGFLNSVIQSLLEVSHALTLIISDAVITYTREYALASRVLGALTRAGVKKRVYDIVPPIPEFAESKTRTRAIRKTIGPADFVIGIAARLSAEKGFEHMLDAMRRLPVRMRQRVRLAVAGPLDPVGEHAYRQRIMALVRAHGKRVVFLGEITPEHMGSFYRAIDVLVLPSVNSTEAFGLVQVEALRSGVPVIASDLPGVRVPVRTTGAGILVPPGQPEALAQALVDIYNNPDTYRPDPVSVRRSYDPNAAVRALRAVITDV